MKIIAILQRIASDRVSAIYQVWTMKSGEICGRHVRQEIVVTVYNASVPEVVSEVEGKRNGSSFISCRDVENHVARGHVDAHRPRLDLG